MENIQKLHDGLLDEARQYRKLRIEYTEMQKNKPILVMNTRLYQGYESALYKVVNDLRHILELPSLEEVCDGQSFGFVFNVE